MSTNILLYEKAVSARKLKTEEKRAQQAAYGRRLRADARAANPAKNKRSPDTPEVIAQRERVRLYRINNPEKVAKNQTIQRKNRAAEQKDRIAAAIAQAEATQRNVDAAIDEDDA